MSTSSVPSPLIPLVLRLIRRNRKYVDADVARKHVGDVTENPRPFDPPKRLRSDVHVSLDDSSGWPVFTLTPSPGVLRPRKPRPAVLYAHGGAWVNEIVSQHWHLAAKIAAEAQTPVIVPIYPLVPFGTAAEVLGGFVALARAAVADHGSVVLAGDSAGGQIALSTALALRDEGILAAHTILIAPAIDLTLSNPQIDVVQPDDPWLGREGTRVYIDLWKGDLDVRDPTVSPLFGDLAGLGPMTIFIGGRDICQPDSRLLADRVTAAGVSVDYRELPGMVHVYPLLPIAEGCAARKRMVEIVRGRRG